MYRGIAWFVGGFAGAFALRFTTGLLVHGGWLFEPELTASQRAPYTLLAPIAAAGLTVAGMQVMWPRRLFDRRVRRRLTQIGVGFASGFAAASLAAVGALFITSFPVKVTMLVVLSSFFTAYLLRIFPRQKPSECVHCGCRMDAADTRCPGCWAEDCRGAV